MLMVEHLRKRAGHANREDFLAFLDGSRDAPPMADDEVPSPVSK
jgi:hypothetical protein